jgi:hypothetical protein
MIAIGFAIVHAFSGNVKNNLNEDNITQYRSIIITTNNKIAITRKKQ